MLFRFQWQIVKAFIEICLSPGLSSMSSPNNNKTLYNLVAIHILLAEAKKVRTFEFFGPIIGAMFYYHLKVKDFPINKGMFKNSCSDHEVTSVKISPKSRHPKLTKHHLNGKAQSWVLKKHFIKNIRHTEYSKTINNGPKKFNKEKAKLRKNDIV